MVEQGSHGRRVIKRFPHDGTFMTFVEDFLLLNEPCVFGDTFTEEWKARQTWREIEKDIPNFDFLEKEFGHATVPVADCASEEFSTHPKKEMSFKDYIQYWRSKVTSLSPVVVSCPGSPLSKESGNEATPVGANPHLLYLKDWHFVKEFPKYDAYTVPDFFRSDWLNEVWSVRRDVVDDYQFVYMGPKGTWTPFHVDVFRSYSWSANVCGCKEWLLYPPGEESHLRDKCGHLPFDITSSDLKNTTVYPNAHKATGPIRVVQNSGEIIFVPSGWHHQVRNIEHTISINHNWTNAFGVSSMWTHLRAELRLVERELDDCRAMEGWEDQCQTVLKACTGMNDWEFVQFLCLAATARLNKLKERLSHESTILDWFKDLIALINRLQTKPTSTTEFTFLNIAEELTNVQTFDLVESTIKANVGPMCASQADVHLNKLVGLLPNSLQDRVMAVRDLGMYSTVEMISIVFRVYELYVINSLLPRVLNQ